MKIRPLQDRIIVQADRRGRKDQGRHHHPRHGQGKAPDGARSSLQANGKKTEDGKVVPMDVKKGDKVLFSKYAGTEVKIDGEDY